LRAAFLHHLRTFSRARRLLTPSPYTIEYRIIGPWPLEVQAFEASGGTSTRYGQTLIVFALLLPFLTI